MARNDSRRFRDPADAPANSWRALANVTVASALVVAVVVSALALVEAVFSTSTVRLARHAPHPSDAQSSHAHAATHEPFLPTPVQAEPALHVAD